jgi:hypothetical protein
MSARRSPNTTFLGGLFGWRKEHEPKLPEQTNQSGPVSTTNTKRIICFRVEEELDRRISRAQRGQSCSRSDFIRSAIERVLKLDGEERLRAAHSAIRWE